MSKEKKLVPKLRFPEFEDEWKKTSLINHIDLVPGFAFKSKFFSDRGKKLVTPKNFTTDGRANFNKESTKYTTEKFDTKYICAANDLLLLLTDLTPSCELLGKPVLLKQEDGEVLLNQRIVKIKIKSDLDKSFLLQYFLSYQFHRRIKRTATGSTVRHSSNKIILSTELLIPNNNKEQQKIASCLSSLDELITAHKDKLEALKDHKKGLMQNLFPQEGQKTPNYRFPEFEKSGKWDVKELGEICDLQAGKFVSASEINEQFIDGLYPCFGGNGLRGYTKSFTHSGKYPLIGRQGALCGNVTLADGQFHATEHAVVITPKENVDTTWLFYVLILLNLNQYATGQAQPGLSVTNLEKVELNIPESGSEQQKIASCLSSLDDLITAQVEKTEQLQLHKKGLMQGLFPKIAT